MKKQGEAEGTGSELGAGMQSYGPLSTSHPSRALTNPSNHLPTATGNRNLGPSTSHSLAMVLLRFSSASFRLSTTPRRVDGTSTSTWIA